MIFEARHARRLQIVAASGCLLLFAFGLYIALIGSAGEAWPMTGYGIALASALGIMVFVMRLLGKDVIMRIDEQGVDWKRVSRPIPWSEIVSSKLVRVNRVPMLCITLKDPKAYPLKGAFARMAAVGDRALGFGAMGLNVANTDRSFNDMLAAIRHYRPDLI